jgi:nitrogen-specific signal transduction histidine kinase
MTQEAQVLAVNRIACLLADRIPDPAIFCDGSGLVLVTNAAFEDKIGVSRQEVMGKPLSWTGIVTAEIAASWIERWSTGPNGGWSERVEIRTPSGSCVETVSLTPLRWGEETDYAFCILLKGDCSNPPRPSYRMSDACGAVSRYASKAAHDLRNPLTGISTGVQYLGRSLKDHPKQAEALTAILTEIKNLDDHIERLARVGRTTAEIQPATLDLGAAVAESLERCRGDWEAADLRPSVSIDPFLPEIRGDGEQIVRSFAALVRHAVAAATPRSTLRVRATLRPATPLNGHGDASREWAWVLLDCPTTLSDPREYVEVLDPSSSGWKSQTDLYQAARIVEAHHGHMEVSGHPGRSIRFSVLLPV